MVDIDEIPALKADVESLATLIGTWRFEKSPVQRVVKDDLLVVPATYFGWQAHLSISRGDIVLQEFDQAGVLQQSRCLNFDHSSSDKIVWGYGQFEEVWIRAMEQRWRDFVVILSSGVCDSGLQIIGCTMSGKQVTCIKIEEPASTSWIEARRMMAKDLMPYLSRSKVRFVTCSGKTLTVEDDNFSIGELFSLTEAGGEPTAEL
mmetsp:Transcript_42821/g.80323  ORF Transcript_42821/g.80323 Transcript_42821/m.80323 type:complete len:204 (-) Transcript_42821:38-649(-)